MTYLATSPRWLCMVAICVMAASLAGCDVSCENEVIESVVSPSTKNKAVLFTRNCGATTGFNTQVSVVPSDASNLSEAGNTLVQDGQAQIQLTWRSERELVISGARIAGAHKRATEVGGISVIYE